MLIVLMSGGAEKIGWRWQPNKRRNVEKKAVMVLGSAKPCRPVYCFWPVGWRISDRLAESQNYLPRVHWAWLRPDREISHGYEKKSSTATGRTGF